MRRLFISIELPGYVLDELEHYINSIKNSVNGRFISRGKLHVTVLFLGNPKMSDEEIKEIVTNESVNLHIELGDLGVFPSEAKPRVLFIRVKTDLDSIYRDLCQKFSIKPELNFVPHITICRLNTRSDLPESLKNLPHTKNLEFSTDHMSLFNSDMKSYYKI